MTDPDAALQFASRAVLKRYVAEKRRAIIRRALLLPVEQGTSSLDVVYFAVEWSPPNHRLTRISAAAVPLTYGPSGAMIMSAQVFYECDPPPFTTCPPIHPRDLDPADLSRIAQLAAALCGTALAIPTDGFQPRGRLAHH